MPKTGSSSTSSATSRVKQLDRLAAEIRACRLCVEHPRGKPLPHAPRPVLRVSATARIAIAGQAPGKRVHASGIPFSDPSGVRLRQWLGVSDAEFYDEARIAIIPMGFCFPGYDSKGGDLPPRRECAPQWRAALFDLLTQLELVVLVGHHAHRWHLGPGAGANMTETVQAQSTRLAPTARPTLIALPHPSWRNNAWITANPWFETDVLPPLRTLIRRIIEGNS